jgi:hypothetical protein
MRITFVGALAIVGFLALMVLLVRFLEEQNRSALKPEQRRGGQPANQ